MFDKGRYILLGYKRIRWNEELQSQVQINPQDYNVQINPQEPNVSWNIFIVLNKNTVPWGNCKNIINFKFHIILKYLNIIPKNYWVEYVMQIFKKMFDDRKKGQIYFFKLNT